VAPRACRGELVRELVALLAGLAKRIALLGESGIGRVVRGPGLGNRRLDRGDFVRSRLRFGPSGFGGMLSLDPARMQQPRFDLPDLIAELAVAFGRFCLAPELGR